MFRIFALIGKVLEVCDGARALDLGKATLLFNFLPPPGRLASLEILDFGIIVLYSTRFRNSVYFIKELIVLGQIVVGQCLLPAANKAFKRVIHPWRLVR